MTSKFFTWTKGDRKHAADMLAAGGIIPIPAECISIKGMDVRKTPKVVQAPAQQQQLIEHQLGTLSNRSSSEDDVLRRSPTAFALQDAAVESATSLMAVVNEMLNSPHVSAHLTQRASLQPPHGRPRSRTAPTTPRFEAPPMEPVELPGCFPSATVRQKPVFEDNVRPIKDTPSQPITPKKTHRSHAKAHSVANVPRPLIDSIARVGSPRMSADNGTRRARTFSWEAEAPPHNTSPVRTASRPTLAALQPPVMGVPSVASPAPTDGGSSSRSISMQQEDLESTLLGQISAMRASHDAHIRSLKCAHDNEVASHLAYISFLERRQLDRAGVTAHTPPIELPGTVMAPPTSNEGTIPVSEDTIDQVEVLRRKLSIVRKEQAESTEIRAQRDQLREALEQRDRRVLQLKEAARRAKEAEKTLRNTVMDLEARLEQANNQRLDVLEGFHVACSTLKAVSRNKPATELARCLSQSVPARAVSPSTFKSSHPANCGEQDLNEMCARVKELQIALQERESKLSDLDAAMQARAEADKHNADRLQDLQKRLDEQQSTIALAEGERAKYYALLQGELRRQARMDSRSSSVTPSITAKAAAKVGEITTAAKTALRTSALNEGEVKSIPGLLEKELEHCISEIIMYKLDVRGYRKDLKEAKAQIAELQAECSRRSSSSSTSQSSCGSSNSDAAKQGSSGLGIILPYPTTPPTKTIGAATAEALLAVTASPGSIAMPSHRPRTPMATYKKLPKPPHLTPSPVVQADGSPPAFKIARVDTARSAADSIIASYAHRASPELRCVELTDGPMLGASPMMTVS